MDAAHALIRLVFVRIVHARAPSSCLLFPPRLAIGVLLLEENRFRVHRRRRRWRVLRNRDLDNVQLPRIVGGSLPVDIGLRVFRIRVFLVVRPRGQECLVTTATGLPVFVHE